MACSQEEIENKRLQAVEKMRAKKYLLSENSSENLSAYQYSTPTFKKYESILHDNRSGPFRNTGYHKSKYQPYFKKTPGAQSPNSSNVKISTAKIICGTSYLISEDRFEVNPSAFDEQLISIFKTIPSRSYDSEKRLWNFSLEHYNELQKRILPLKPHIVIGRIPQYVMNVMEEPTTNCNADLFVADNYIMNKLLPFQVDGVMYVKSLNLLTLNDYMLFSMFGIAKKGRCMIADDMGLGKTLQALAIANYYKADWPLLIVTTSSMRETWQNHVHEYLPSVPTVSIVCVSSGKEKICVTDKQAEIVIISYKMASLSVGHLIDKRFGAVILDESHLLKSHKARVTECIMKITKYAKRAILLTGTPALSRPIELFTQLKIIDPKFFSGYTEFGKRYCDAKRSSFGWDMSGQSNLLELQSILQKKFLIRRTKEDVLPSLKEKTRESVILSPSLLAVNKETEKNLFELADNYRSKAAAHKHSALLNFFYETGKVKAPAIRKYVADIIETNEKFLIFAHHRSVMEAISLTLDEHRVHYIFIDGSTKGQDRSTLVETFQFNDSCRCAVLSITAACAGITLTAAQLVIFAELHWNPGILNQAESRAHRIGQKGNVSIRYLLAEGTADDFMWPLLQKKLQVLNQTGLSNDTFENTTLSKQDVSKNETSLKKMFSKMQNDQNSFIPGTNVMKGTDSKQVQMDSGGYENATDSFREEDLETTFHDDDEGDELLAGLLM